jgi:hypothetical protein
MRGRIRAASIRGKAEVEHVFVPQFFYRHIRETDWQLESLYVGSGDKQIELRLAGTIRCMLSIHAGKRAQELVIHALAAQQTFRFVLGEVRAIGAPLVVEEIGKIGLLQPQLLELIEVLVVGQRLCQEDSR